ncbi:MAG: PSD1 and planctomycete cytochrome C domain-containing protein, partial [Planctomycetaceae bacterium]
CTVPLIAGEQSGDPVFEEDVRPIFETYCFKCHGEIQKSELDLRSRQSILRGSESGPILSQETPEESRLYEVIHEGHMPPEDEKQLAAVDEETIQRWITAGARFRNSETTDAGRVNQHVILPILQLRCTVCHGRQKPQADLDLRTKASILKGGKSGPAMVPGNPGESLLLKRIHAKEMPPLDKLAAVSVKPMDKAEIALLSAWISAGAPEEDIPEDVADHRPDPLVSEEDRNFWSFQPPRAVSIPEMTELASNPVDAFMQRELIANGMNFSPEADRTTLIRRATFDLTGLPPTPDEVNSFLADTSIDAWQRVIERLLVSPRYGERWGRYWLDLAGYSDSEGGQHADQVRREAYRYRDYVVRSLNNDKPYDRFLVEQIAGDELVDYRHADSITDEIYDNLVATGFLRMAPDGTYAGITAFVPDRLEIIDDEIEVLSSSVMGLTVRCARCHSHKFDPIPQRDYYRLAAVFKGAIDEHDWLEPTKRRFLNHVQDEERHTWQSHEQGLDAEIESVQQTLAEKQTEFTKRHAPDSPDAEALKKLEPEFAEAAKQAEKSIKAIEERREPEPRIRALWDRGEPSPTYLLKRGNYLTPGRPVGPGVPSVLTNGMTPFDVEPPFEATTGRRLAFARWLTNPGHPLTARVMVNRIWKHHFGTGIVSTLDNFGATGARPTHPELLDWLSTEFVRQGWSIKTMHRLLMNSMTWRQSSDVTPQHMQLDPDNRLISRMPMRRMEGEVLRDCLLSVAGRLDLRPYGPADALDSRDDGLVVSVGQDNRWRRTIYVLQRRTAHLTILDNFDLPQLNPNCIERRDSIVAPQALHLLNNKRVHEFSRFFAARIRREAGDDPAAQIEQAWLVACGRHPTDDEREMMLTSLSELTSEWLRKLDGVKTAVPAAAHLWIRHSHPDTVYEDDLISVWSQARELRRGLVEFDVSNLGDETWKAARLDLGVLQSNSFKQSAMMIPPGIERATWSSYEKTKASHQQAFEHFGRIQSGETDVPVGTYVKSAPASAIDLRMLNQARRNGRVAFVLIADEDGNPYAHDWDDGTGSSNVPRLVVRHGESDPHQAAILAFDNVCHALMNSADFLYID